MTALDFATLTNNYIVGRADTVKIAILGISNTQESMTRESRPGVPDTSTAQGSDHTALPTKTTPSYGNR